MGVNHAHACRHTFTEAGVMKRMESYHGRAHIKSPGGLSLRRTRDHLC